MSAPMIGWEPLVNRIHKFFTASDYSAQSIDIAPVETHDVETAPDKRPRTLKHLIRANHVNHSIIYHDLEFHNHMPHILGSAYIFGASVDQMHTIYAKESKELEPWHDSPAEVTNADWRDFLGDPRYQRAYVDFFEDELALNFNYDWTKVAEEYLFGGKHPLINGVIGGSTSYCSSWRVILLMLNTSWSPADPYWLCVRIIEQRIGNGGIGHGLHLIQLSP